MFQKRIGLFLLLCLIIITTVMPGCRQATPNTLRIAILPILDTLPLYVAESAGYFAEHGLLVEFIPVASAAERDQLLQAGQVDGIVTDLVALALYNQAETQVVAVRYAMKPTPNFAQFRIMAAADAKIATAADLKGVSIGISEGTGIEYVTTRMLEAEGLSANHITTLAVPKIPDRMALLNAGKLQAATLPEPLGTLVMQQGATVVVDDTQYLDLSCSIFAFRKEVVDNQSQSVENFLAALSQASDAINADKTQWASLLVEQKLIPPPLLESYTLPDYPNDAVPTVAQFADVVAWLEDTGRLKKAPVYADVVRADWLSQ